MPHTRNGNVRGVYLPHLRAWRVTRYLSPSSVAYRAGITAAWVHELEAGRARASLPTVARIARALGISPHTLVERPPEARDSASAGAATPATAANTGPAPTAAPEGPVMAGTMT